MNYKINLYITLFGVTQQNGITVNLNYQFLIETLQW